MDNAIAGIITTLIASGLVYLGVRFKARMDAKVATTPTKKDRIELLLERYDVDREETDKQIATLGAELLRVKNEQTAERAQWAEERQVFQTKLEAKDIMIAELTGEVRELRGKLERYETKQNAVNASKVNI